MEAKGGTHGVLKAPARGSKVFLSVYFDVLPRPQKICCRTYETVYLGYLRKGSGARATEAGGPLTRFIPSASPPTLQSPRRTNSGEINYLLRVTHAVSFHMIYRPIAT
jgi:hypothetical protein